MPEMKLRNGEMELKQIKEVCECVANGTRVGGGGGISQQKSKGASFNGGVTAAN